MQLYLIAFLFSQNRKAINWRTVGIGLAFQGGVEMSEQDANEYGASSKRIAMDQVFGTGGLELGEQGALSTESPLVAKLVA